MEFRTEYGSAVRVSMRRVVVPFPASRDAWVVFDDGTVTVVSAVAMAWQEEVFQWPGDMEEQQNGKGHKYPNLIGDEAANEDPLLFRTDFWVLVLPADLGNWETPWVEHRRVFFDRTPANEAAEKIRAKAKAE